MWELLFEVSLILNTRSWYPMWEPLLGVSLILNTRSRYPMWELLNLKIYALV